MAADATLAKGAYEATRYRSQGVDKAQGAIGDTLNQAVRDIAKDKAIQKAKEKEKVKTTPEQEPVLEEIKDTETVDTETPDVKPEQTDEKKEQQTFDEAFAAARKKLGPGKKFQFEGKEYTTWYEGEEDKQDEENNNINAENQLATGGNPNKSDLDVITEHMAYLQDEYGFGDEALANKGLVDTQMEVQKFNGLLDSIAQGQVDRNIKGGKDGTGFSSVYGKGNQDYDWAIGIMSNSQNNKSNFSFQEDEENQQEGGGQYGKDMGKSLKVRGPEGNYITVDQATKKIQGMMVDVDASNAFNAIFDGNLSKIKDDKSAVLNTAEVESQVNDWINSSNSVSSIMHDTMFKGSNSSWVEDFKKGLIGIPLEGLGISEEEFELYNKNSPGVISMQDGLDAEDADALIELYTTEDNYADHAKSTVHGYFTGIIKNNHRKVWEAEYPNEVYPGSEINTPPGSDGDII